jgi:hypothetical protein
MLTRRGVLLASGCALFVKSMRANAGAVDQWICTTIDPTPQPGLSIQDYSALSESDLALLRQVVKQFKLTNFGTQLLAERWRPSDGLTPNIGIITLGVAFLDNDPMKVQYVTTIAPKWLDGPTLGSLDTSLKHRIAFKFGVQPRDGQIRITFDPKLGNNSQVGRQNLLVPDGQYTMNIADLEEYVVLHEFGHALGLHHEQASPHTPIKWDEAAIVADLSKPPANWSLSTIRAQVEKKYPSNYACIGDPGFNITSIMIYPIPKAWTKNGFSSPLNENISARDFKCLAAVYRA